MIRAVLDVNVLVLATMTRGGAPGRLINAWNAGLFELVASPLLLDELAEVLERPRIRKRLSEGAATRLLSLMRSQAHIIDDPKTRARTRSADPDDNYLIDLASTLNAALVSGDRHLTDLRATIPVFSPAEFLDYLAAA